MAYSLLSGYRYSQLSPIGSCPQGAVFKATDEKTNSEVAVKVVWNVSDPAMRSYLVKEVAIMTHFPHANLIGVRRVRRPTENLCVIVTDLMETTLAHILKQTANITKVHIQVIFYQILSGLQCLNSAGICHSGVSPLSVLLNANCDVKLAGLQGCTQHGEDIETCHWVTQCLPPEAGKNDRKATEAVDVWESGVVFLCLLLGRDITAFCPAESLPSLIPSLLSSYHSQFSSETCDLLFRLLENRPEARITLRKALEHPFFASLDLELSAEPQKQKISLEKITEEIEQNCFSCK